MEVKRAKDCVAMEILYTVSILKNLGVQIQYRIEVNVDCIGAVYLAKNTTTGNRTNFIDTRYHFVRKYIEDSIVKAIFVRWRTITQISSPKT